MHDSVEDSIYMQDFDLGEKKYAFEPTESPFIEVPPRPKLRATVSPSSS